MDTLVTKYVLIVLELQTGSRKDWRQAGCNSTRTSLFVLYMFRWSLQDECSLESYKLAWAQIWLGDYRFIVSRTNEQEEHQKGDALM